MIRIASIIIPFIYFLSACQLSSLSANLNETPPGAVLFQDDFSDPSSGWKITNDYQSGTMDYFDNFFRIQVLGEFNLLTSNPGLDFEDVQIKADMIKVIGGPDDMFGLVCRVIDPENYYFFVISSDGYYGIGKVIAGHQTMLGSQGLLPSEIISQGKSKNHIQVECVAEKLILSVNGQELAQVEDSELDHGAAGILAATMQDDENVVLFDNFSVIHP